MSAVVEYVPKLFAASAELDVMVSSSLLVHLHECSKSGLMNIAILPSRWTQSVYVGKTVFSPNLHPA
jgi:hypothetical protein